MLRWPRDKRHFYQSLWSCAEDSCCIEDDMFEVKLTAWASPLDADMTVELFETWRDELIADGKLIPYTNGEPDKRYLYLPDMAKHESPRNPQAPDIALPPWVTMEVTGEGREKRIRYEHGSRDGIVETDSGDRKASPVLTCPVLSVPDPTPCAPKPAAPTPRGTEYTPAFEEWWKAYPCGRGKAEALKAWHKACKIIDAESLLTALGAYRWQVVKGENAVPHASTWLNQRRWEDEPDTTSPASSEADMRGIQ